MSNFFESLTKIVVELNHAISHASNKTGGYEPSTAGVEGAVVIPSLMVTNTGQTIRPAVAQPSPFSTSSVTSSSALSTLYSSTAVAQRHYPTPPQPFFQSFGQYMPMPKFVLLTNGSTMAPENTTASLEDVFQEASFESILRLVIPEDSGLFETVVHLLLLIFCFLMGGVTVFLNAVVIRCFFKESSVRTPSNYFIISLAFTDLSIGLLSLPVYTMYLILEERWPFGETFCDLWLAIDYTLCLVSQYTVFAITVDRFFSVKFPAMYHRWLTKPRALAAIMTIWLVSGVVFHVTIIGWQYFVGERTVPPERCYVQFIGSAFFNMIFVIGYFWSTLLVIIVLYVQIFVVVYRRSERTRKITEATLETLRKNIARHSRHHHASYAGGGGGSDCDTAATPVDEEHEDENGHLHVGNSSNNNRRMTRDDGVLMNDGNNAARKRSLFSADIFATMALRLKKTAGLNNGIAHDHTDAHHTCAQGGCLLKASWQQNGTVSVTCNRSSHSKSARPLIVVSEADSEDLTPAKRMLSAAKSAASSHASSNYSEQLDASPSDGDRDETNKTLAEAVDLLKSEAHQSAYRFSSLAALTSRPSILCKQLLSFRRVRDRQVRRTFLMISVILGVFVLTWSPYHILAIVKGFCNECVPKSLYNLTYWFCYTNSPINPICYAFFNKKFREAFYRVFHIRKNKYKNRTLHALMASNLPKS